MKQSTVTSARTIQTDIPALKEVLGAYFPVGAAIEPYQTSGPHSELLARHFNSLVAENVMKPGRVQPVEGQFHWAPADTLIAFARANQMQVRGHTLVWHNQNPEWLFLDDNGSPLQATPAQKTLLLGRLEAHIRAVVGRYKDAVYAWDVVNEVIDPEVADGMRRTEWYRISGLDYIEAAFHLAREVAPEARLYINDYDTTDQRKRELLYNLVRKLLARGVPIDGVGHQLHINIERPAAAEIEETIALFAGLGLDNQVTELDMSVYTNRTDRYSEVPEKLLITQGQRYREVFDVLRRQAGALSSVTFWGIADAHTWLKGFPIKRLDLPLLFDEQLQAKPAYWGVVDPSRLPPLE